MVQGQNSGGKWTSKSKSLSLGGLRGPRWRVPVGSGCLVKGSSLREARCPALRLWGAQWGASLAGRLGAGGKWNAVLGREGVNAPKSRPKGNHMGWFIRFSRSFEGLMSSFRLLKHDIGMSSSNSRRRNLQKRAIPMAEVVFSGKDPLFFVSICAGKVGWTRDSAVFRQPPGTSLFGLPFSGHV